MAKLASDLLKIVLARPYSGSSEDRINIRRMSSGLLDRFIQKIELRRPNTKDPRFVSIEANARLEIKLLQYLTRYYVIENPALSTQQYGKAKVIEQLFNIILEAATKYDFRSVRSMSLLPERCRENLRRQMRRPGLARIVADTISSFTDAEALVLHARLTGVRTGSILDGLPV